MFGFAKKIPPAAPASEPASSRGRPAPLRLVRERSTEIAEYLKLTQSLGFKPAALVHEKLLDFLSDSGIEVYPLPEVQAYMDDLADKAKKDWRWTPLRHEDSPSTVRGVDMPLHIWPLYQQLVPLTELRKIEQIEKALGKGAVHFFVSDYAAPDPDPFLLAWVAGMPMGVVIGCWDEPGFTGKAESAR